MMSRRLCHYKEWFFFSIIFPLKRFAIFSPSNCYPSTILLRSHPFATPFLLSVLWFHLRSMFASWWETLIISLVLHHLYGRRHGGVWEWMIPAPILIAGHKVYESRPIPHDFLYTPLFQNQVLWMQLGLWTSVPLCMTSDSLRRTSLSDVQLVNRPLLFWRRQLHTRHVKGNCDSKSLGTVWIQYFN